MSDATEPDDDVVLYETRDAVAIVTMHRPQYRNAQNARMTYALEAAFTRAVQDDEFALRLGHQQRA